jgi:TPR repeat protein
MKHDVFISYKSELIGLVEKFVNNLEQQYIDGHQIHCWYAPRDLDENATQDDFDDEILDAIKGCKMAVAFINDAALTSRWVKFEIDQAWERGKFILPTAVDELTIDNAVIAKLSGKHRINAYPQPEEQLGKVINKTLAQLKGEGLHDSSEESAFLSIADDQLLEMAKIEEGAGDTKEAVRHYLGAAILGNKNAQLRLCALFYEHAKNIGEICQGEELDIIRQEADNKGDSWACFLMHCLYYNNSLFQDSDNIKSFHYAERSCRKNEISLAWLRLAIHYGWGLGVKQDHALEKYYYEKAYEAGCIQALSYLGQKYQFGDDKTAVDTEKAEYYYQKGAEQGDKRSMMKLAEFYMDDDQFIKAHDVAQQMINKGYYYGFILFGNIEERNDNYAEAIKMYKLAIKHDIYEGYSELANHYWNNNNHEEAYRLINKGCQLHDYGSYYMLGYFYMMDENFDEAWSALLLHYQYVGGGADLLGKLFFEYEYRKEDKQAELQLEQQLGDALEVSAFNGNEDCMLYYIQLLSLQETGTSEAELDSLMNIPHAVEMIKIGAQMHMPSMMYYYGLMLMDDNFPNSNPLKGIQFLQDAALAGDEDSINYLFYYGREGKYAQDVDLPKLAYYSMIFSNMERDADILLLGLRYAISKLKQEQDNWLYHRCLDIINDMRKQGFLGYVKRLGDDLSLFYPDYFNNEEAELNRFVEQGNYDSLYYIINYASEYENDVNSDDKREMRPSYGVSKLWLDGVDAISELYSILCVRYQTNILDYFSKPSNWKYDYIPSREAQKLNVMALRGICQMSKFCGNYGSELINLITDSDSMIRAINNMDDIDNDIKRFIHYCTLLHEEALKVLYNNSELEETKSMTEEEEEETIEEDVAEEIVYPQVYISYISDHSAIVEKLVNYLEHNGIDCWYKDRDAKEKVKEKKIEEENIYIEQCKVVITIADNKMVQSADINDELTMIWNQKKPIIPFVVGRISIRNNVTAKLAKFRNIFAYPRPDFSFDEVELRVRQWLDKYE